MGVGFSELGIEKDLVEELNNQGITEPFEIQKITIPDILEGRDVCGKAKTGSGKQLHLVCHWCNFYQYQNPENRQV